ncbi:MAG TPA: hypothetical protein ENN56_00280 [Firmicutes bacterium]|nr:hypothetical protein [Bacillota bacterium]
MNNTKSPAPHTPAENESNVGKKPIAPLGVDHEAHRRAVLVRTHWLRWFFGLSAVFIVAAIVIAIAYRSGAAQQLLIGWAISFVMCLLSGWLAFGSIGRSMNRIMLVAFGGMLLRMVIVGASVAVAVVTHTSYLVFFVAGLMGGYVLYQALEIFMLKSVVRIASGATE